MTSGFEESPTNADDPAEDDQDDQDSEHVHRLPWRDERLQILRPIPLPQQEGAEDDTGSETSVHDPQ